MSFLSGLFSGSGSTGSTVNQNTNKTTKYKQDFYQPYLDSATSQLERTEDLVNIPFQKYDVSNFGDMSNSTQQAAWDALAELPGSWDDAFAAAGDTLNTGYGVGSAAFDRAAASPTALSAADPWTQKAGQSWTDVSSDYLNPYIKDTVTAANELTSKNFTDNVLPALGASYVASGGGLGSKDYGLDTDWALTNYNDSVNRTSYKALADAYDKSAGIFKDDATRWGSLSNTVGAQATNDTAAATDLGSKSTASGVLQAGAQSGLATQDLTNSLKAEDATLKAGDQQQAIEDWKNKYDYDQFQAEVQWPYQTNSWAADTNNKYEYPKGYTSTETGNTSTTTTGTSGSSGSPVGTALGTLSAVGSLIPGGWGKLLSMPGGAVEQEGGYTLANMGAKRGGSIRGFSRGGNVGHFSRGGYLGLDAPSRPPFVPNPGYFKWMDSTAFKRGGSARPRHRFDEGGQVGGFLGKLLGSLAGGYFGGPIGAGLGGMGGEALGGLLPFASGGHAPVVRSVRQGDQRALAASRARQAAPQGGISRPLALPNTPSGFFRGA